MFRIAYVNGSYVPAHRAAVHINDRAFQFSDGVYEVVTVRKSKLIDMKAHLDRLDRSLDELAITHPMSRGSLQVIINETLRRNRAHDALLYIQVSRGVAKRDHAFPSTPVRPGLVITCTPLNLTAIRKKAETGVSAITQPDIRWGRCDIKSTSLLPNIMAKQAADEKGAMEAVLVDTGGYITEGSSTNIWIVTKDGELVTRPTTSNILPGITRAALLSIANTENLKFTERSFTVEEACNASEMFMTSSTKCAMPIVSLDSQKIGAGSPGPVTQKLVESYWRIMDA